MKRFVFLLTLIFLMCSLNATTSLDRDFYVKTGLQLEAIKSKIGSVDSTSADGQLLQKVDSLVLGSYAYWNMDAPATWYQHTQIMRLDSAINTNHLIHGFPVFLILKRQNAFDSSNHLTSGYGAFYDLVGQFSYLDLTDVPTISKQVLAVMGIDTDKEFKIYTAVWHLITNYFGDIPPFYDYSFHSVDILSHLDMVAVYTALCCEKFSTYHLYFPQMGDFNN